MDRSHVVSMLDGEALQEIILYEKPDLVVLRRLPPMCLQNWLKENQNSSHARATQLTMNREGIRRLAAEEVGLKTSPINSQRPRKSLRLLFPDRNTMWVKPVGSW